MIASCPNCKNQLNINGTSGSFRCPYCQSFCQIAPQQFAAQPGTPLVYGGYASYSSPASTMGTVMSSPYVQQSPYMAQQNPIDNAFFVASGGKDSLTVANLRMALAQLNVHLSDAICNQLFKKHDTDYSGSIQINEFREIHKEVGQWIGVFNSLDMDHSGTMEYPEFVDAMRKLKYNIDPSLLHNLFKSIDTLHNDCIDLNGFIKVVSIIQVLQSKIAVYDPQHTGVIRVDFNGLLDIVMGLPL